MILLGVGGAASAISNRANVPLLVREIRNVRKFLPRAAPLESFSGGSTSKFLMLTRLLYLTLLMQNGIGFHEIKDRALIKPLVMSMRWRIASGDSPFSWPPYVCAFRDNLKACSKIF